MRAGTKSPWKDIGYGVRAVEPKEIGGGSIGIEHGLTLPNARLIAQAPKMLEMLKRIVASHNRRTLGDALWVDSKEVIAEAEED